MAIDSNRIWFAIKGEKDIEPADCYVLPSESVPGLKILEDKLPQIRAEYARVIKNSPIFSPYFEKNLSNPPGSWDTIPLYTFDLKRHYCGYFPELSSFLAKVPGLVGCFVSRLNAGASIGRHSGITNAIFRCQAALELPSGDPEITGFQVGDAVTGLYNDKFISFVDANAHSAWNRADEDRVILIVDIMRPQFRYLRYFMSARIVLSYIILKLSEKRGMGVLAWFIRRKISRFLISFFALPLVPFFYCFVKLGKLR